LLPSFQRRTRAKARAFYEGTLGLGFVKDDGFALVLDANGIMVRITKAPDFKPVQFTILGWQVFDIEKVVPALVGKGVHFERWGFFEQDKLGIWTAPNGDKVACSRTPMATSCRFPNTSSAGSLHSLCQSQILPARRARPRSLQQECQLRQSVDMHPFLLPGLGGQAGEIALPAKPIE
jgi:hypothetical protein